ncbi:hypothetical protein WKI45_22675 [Delftia tsuruhatensis]
MLYYIRILIYCAFIVAAFMLNVKGVINYVYADFKDFVAALIAISGMVFTIMGIWIAFLYPNAIARIVSENIEPADFTEGGDDAKRLEKIVAAVLMSALVAFASAFCYMAKMFLGATNFYYSNATEIKSLALGFVAFLSVVQFEAILSVVVANVLFLVDLHQKKEKRAQDKSY